MPELVLGGLVTLRFRRHYLSILTFLLVFGIIFFLVIRQGERVIKNQFVFFSKAPKGFGVEILLPVQAIFLGRFYPLGWGLWTTLVLE